MSKHKHNDEKADVNPFEQDLPKEENIEQENMSKLID